MVYKMLQSVTQNPLSAFCGSVLPSSDIKLSCRQRAPED